MDREPSELLPLTDGAALPTFDVALRGYDRRQVDEYLDRLEADLAAAQAERDAAVETASSASSRLDALEQQVQAARKQLLEAGRPTYAGLGARVEELLRLAEEQAMHLRADAARAVAQGQQQAESVLTEAKARAAKLDGEFQAAMTARRAAADSEVAAHRADAQQRLQAAEKRVAETDTLAQRRVAQASAEVDRRAKEAAAQLDRTRSDAERHAAALVQAARADAERVLEQARSQASRIVADAQADAERRRANSEREISALHARREAIDRQLESVRAALNGLPAGGADATAEPATPSTPASGPSPAGGPPEPAHPTDRPTDRATDHPTDQATRPTTTPMSPPPHLVAAPPAQRAGTTG